MITVKPSEGLHHARETVFVEGVIAGHKSHSNTQGGRWIVRIGDIDSPKGQSNATLVLNENPDQNTPVHVLGVRSPNNAVLALFNHEKFNGLFQLGMTFRAEAIIGNYNGDAWFNVSQIMLFNPEFMIGSRQLYREPICERRLLLRSRGIKGNRSKTNNNLGGFFIGNLVHSTFQKIATSPDRDNIISEFMREPNTFMVRSIQLEDALIGAIARLWETPRISGAECTRARNHIKSLIESQGIHDLLAQEPRWFSEVPVSGHSIHGNIDLRSEPKILELKTGLLQEYHSNQLCSYLVGEMLEHGYSIKDLREGYLISSSEQIGEDRERVKLIRGDDQMVQETLERFLLSRHRLLLASSGSILPKIEYDVGVCQGEHCEYCLEYGNEFGSACHFYCQTDRNWSCDGCRHSAQCTEHSKHHSFEVLDEANRIRSALAQEIEYHRKWSQNTKSWATQFEVIETENSQRMSLRPLSWTVFDPPSPGEKIIIKHEQGGHPVNGLVLGIDEDGNWKIVSRGEIAVSPGEKIQLIQPRDEFNAIYSLQGCLDELQRLGSVSHREGIAFAGGSIVSGQPQRSEEIGPIISDCSITDIFCQSFNLKASKKILEEFVPKLDERVLIVTDASNSVIDECIDLRCLDVLKISSGATSILDALERIKAELKQHECWVVSPDILLETDILSALPRAGQKFFKYIVVYETNSITSLEYFLIRQYGEHVITIGDANCVGRSFHSKESKLLGLTDNLMTRVYGRGFPRVEGRIIPQMLDFCDQEIDSKLNNALKSCRMVTASNFQGDVKIEIEQVAHDSDIQGSEDQLMYSFELAISSDGPPKELKLKIDEVISISEIENDLMEIKPSINNLLVEGKQLIPPTSGRNYDVKRAPYNRGNGEDKWLIQIYVQIDQSNVNTTEAEIVIQKLSVLKSDKVKAKNLAIMSTSVSQLNMLAENYGDELKGIALRTPYGIRGESWGNIIISCVTQNPQEIDVRELYTMIRAAKTRVIIIGERGVVDYHPLLRNII